MEFCSKYGYDYGFQGSDEETIEDEEKLTKLKVNRKVRKIDTNIIACKFDRLVLSNNSFAGDFVSCKQCKAIVTGLSKKSINEKDLIWVCEYCFESNDLSKLIKNLDELPNDDDVTFLLEPATSGASTISSVDTNTQPLDSNYLTFCIDVSGSMDETIMIKKFKDGNDGSFDYERTNMSRLEGVKVACIETLKSLKDEDNNKLVSMVTFSDNIKFFGDCISGKAIVDTSVRNSGRFNRVNPFYPIQSNPNQSQVSQPSKKAPRTKSSFLGSIKAKFTSKSSGNSNSNSDTEETSDTDNVETETNTNTNTIAEDILENKEKMLALAKNQDGNLKPVSATYKYLEQKIKSLRTEGSTALGPGLVFSIGFSTKKKGSQVCVCTDGCANVGMGRIEHVDIQAAEKFYNELADYAKENGVNVNVISMEGTDCKLSLLGKLADKTNGTMKIVNPLNLSEEFKSILENRMVATNVNAKLIVNHKYLYIRNEELEALEGKAIDSDDFKAKEELNQKKKSIDEKEIGNALMETEITFEYGIRKLDKASKTSDSFKELPFQLQITYTSLDGSKSLRVYSKHQEFTKDREVAEKNVASNDLVFSNATQKMTHLTIENSVASAQYRAKALDNYASKNAMAMPSSYLKKANLVKGFSKSQRYDEMDDIASEEMYKGKKQSRNFK